MGKIVQSQFPFQNYWRQLQEVNLQDQNPEQIEQQTKGVFVQRAKSFYGIEDVLFVDCNMPFINKASFRHNAGQKKMKALIKELNLKEKYNEITFVSHSAGAAFATGMIEEALSQSFIIGQHLMLAPFQINRLKISPNHHVLQINVEGDKISKKSGFNFIAENVAKSMYLHENLLKVIKKAYPELNNSNHGIVRMLPEIFDLISK